MTTKNSNNDRHEVIYTRTGGDPITPDSIDKSKRTGLKFFAFVFGGAAIGAWYVGLGGLAMAALAVGAIASIGLILSARKAQSAGQTRAITGAAIEAVDDAQSIRHAIEQAALPEAISADLTSSLEELVQKAKSLSNSKVETEAALSRIPVTDTEIKLQESIDKSDSDSANIHMKTLKQAEALERQVEKIEEALGKVQNGMLAQISCKNCLTANPSRHRRRHLGNRVAVTSLSKDKRFFVR